MNIRIFILIGFIVFASLLVVFPKEETQRQEDSSILVPIDIYLVNDAGKYSTQRDIEEVQKIFLKVNEIWNEYGLVIEINRIIVISLDQSFESRESLLRYLINKGHHDANLLNGYFAGTIDGPNGIAYPGNIFMISDITTVNDFRAVAHEIGHNLGLKHVRDVDRLMAQGVNGIEILDYEGILARDGARNFK